MGRYTPLNGDIEGYMERSKTNRLKMEIVDNPEARYSLTHYKTLKTFLNNSISKVEFNLETGRTHQIRVHMASIRHPLLGDTIYGPKNAMGLTGQCLHARVLGFVHPRTGKYVEFEAPLPKYFQKLLEKYSQK